VGELPAAVVIAFVLPGDVEDETLPSGGNNYDLRMCRTLKPSVHAVDGAWPTPDGAAKSKLYRVLDGLPDGASVLLDGLVACGVPEVILPHANRLRLAVLVHLPLAAETGLDPAVAADLDARERRTLHAVGGVIATSPWAARRLVDHHDLAADRVHVVPPGVDSAPIAPGIGGRLLCVAALTPRKGQDLLAQALMQIADLEWTCECVGPLRRDTDYVHRLRRLISRYGLTDRMTLAGPKTGRDLEASYAAADLMVLPSHNETYGMVLTEALARGIPVLATAVGAVPETVGRAPDGNVPGMLVDPGDAIGLATALRRFLTETDLRQRLRWSALARRDTLPGWDVSAQRLQEVLAHLEREPLCAA
jgi:glycosyltransferase involved in cell wall biosynthesis